jgi:hypothetical protein
MAEINMYPWEPFEDQNNEDVFDACMEHSDSNRGRGKRVSNFFKDNKIDILEATLENTRSQLARLIDAIADTKVFDDGKLRKIIKG